MNRLVLIVFFLIPLSLSAQQKLEFIEEKIDFAINS